MGRQIALQCAMFGFRVTLFDIHREALSSARGAIELEASRLAGAYVPEMSATITQRIYYTLDLEEGCATADIVTESIPEVVELKRQLFSRVHALCQPHTIFTSNSSSLLPSTIAGATLRPERFLALHFHKTVWLANIVDVMPHGGTDPSVVDAVTRFARTIGQIPIVLKAERQGYVFNSMLQAYLGAALALWATDAAAFEDIDRAWMVAERADHGPFGAMDHIGLDTIYDVTVALAPLSPAPAVAASAAKLKVEYLERGRLGVKSGSGFYNYPDPTFGRPEFLKPSSR
jgi:3-hydroxybutyryl-CoA dehydrogenase